jgi:hypothetical protein
MSRTKLEPNYLFFSDLITPKTPGRYMHVVNKWWLATPGGVFFLQSKTRRIFFCRNSPQEALETYHNIRTKYKNLVPDHLAVIHIRSGFLPIDLGKTNVFHSS